MAKSEKKKRKSGRQHIRAYPCACTRSRTDCCSRMFRSLGISCDERLEQAGLVFRLAGVPKVRKASVGPGTRWPAAVNFHVTCLSIVQYSWSPMLTFLACFGFLRADRGDWKAARYANFRLEMTTLYSSATEENFSGLIFDFVKLWVQNCGSKVGDSAVLVKCFAGPRRTSVHAVHATKVLFIAWFDTRDGILRPPDRVHVECHFAACRYNVMHLVDGTFGTIGEFHQF